MDSVLSSTFLKLGAFQVTFNKLFLIDFQTLTLFKNC